MPEKIPSVVIAGAGSGSGKTTICCALLAALKARGISLSAFKCGPDYIDPMFHEKALGIPSKNLDSFFCRDELLKYLYIKQAEKSRFALIEGVMGYYDGLAMDSTAASTYNIAKILGSPVVLVISAKGMAHTVLAIIKGIADYTADSNIKAVILNNISRGVYLSLKPVIESELNIKVIGYMPYSEDNSIDSRHLGLVTPEGIVDIREKIDRLGKLAEECIDLDELIEIADTSAKITTDYMPATYKKSNITIAVAKDEVFCFYYKDNIELLGEMGCKIEYFSPLRDKHIPENADGIILGGGYPELYCSKLSGNHSMLCDIKAKLEGSMPALAECGGFMYLHKKVEDRDKNSFDMVGIINANAFYTGRLVRFGYITLTDTSGKSIKAHEFHYWDSTQNGSEYTAVKPNGKSWECMVKYKNIICGYPHLFYYSNPDFAANFVKRCEEYKESRKCSV